MEVAVDERRRGETTGRVERLRRIDIEVRSDAREPAAIDRDVDDPAVDACVANHDVHRVTVNRCRDRRTGRSMRR